MRVEKDFEDLLKLFNRHKIKYCVVGAFAVAFYAVPRYTQDMDILVEPSEENNLRWHKVFFIGKDELMKSKKASGRKQDKIDLEIMDRYYKRGHGTEITQNESYSKCVI